ncbi:MAG: hypothetical protein RIB60_08930 [Phycisphaerales bacterium]
MARAILILSAAVTLLAASACNVVSPVFYAIHGPEKILPKFTLDPDASTVILVDDPANTVGTRRLRADIASATTRILLDRELVIDMIDPRPALALASHTGGEDPMSITEIGREVDADVVIYVLLTEFQVANAEGSALPSAAAQVKIMDVREGRRVFPDDPRGVAVRLRPEHRAADIGADSTRELALEREQAQRLGLAIAQLFYKHEVPDSATR